MKPATKARARARAGVPAPGDVVAGKYEIGDIIGAGGMGVVVSARHIELGQTVAIKFLDKSLVDNASVSARFFREARAASRIRSEHVTRVLDVARTETGLPYLVMEHLVGEDLAELQKARGTLPIEEVVDYVLQACEALAEAHAAGIVHRDLKPGNLFLTHHADGSPLVKVLDFGISKIIDPSGSSHDGAETTESDMLGSTWYMSPEQVRSSMSVDARTDVWSLGVILYQLLTGAQAFRANTMSACLAKIIADPPPPLREKRPDVPEGLEAIILACLEKDVDHRLQSVAELAVALGPFAPEGAQLSIQRITRVLGSRSGAQSGSSRMSQTATAGPVSSRESGAPTRHEGAITPAPASRPGVLAATPTNLDRPPLTGDPPTGASLSSSALPPAPKSTPRWAVALALVAAVGIGAVLGVRLFSDNPAATVVSATPIAAVPSAAQETTVVPAAPATPTAAATAAPALSASAPIAPRPSKPHDAPPPPQSKPGKLKISGPVETTF